MRTGKMNFLSCRWYINHIYLLQMSAFGWQVLLRLGYLLPSWSATLQSSVKARTVKVRSKGLWDLWAGANCFSCWKINGFVCYNTWLRGDIGFYLESIVRRGGILRVSVAVFFSLLSFFLVFAMKESYQICHIAGCEPASWPDRRPKRRDAFYLKIKNKSSRGHTQNA